MIALLVTVPAGRLLRKAPERLTARQARARARLLRALAVAGRRQAALRGSPARVAKVYDRDGWCETVTWREGVTA